MMSLRIGYQKPLSEKGIASETVVSVIEKRFGDKVVAYDPSDSEANKIAVSKAIRFYMVDS